MKTISQVAELTGISTRTLQYYDEIGLLKPSGLTPSGYRLYDDSALERLQQILFFKELDFKLNDIREMLEKPDFNKIEAFHKQKKLLCLKRDRLNNLIGLLDKLERGEPCMSFKEFDLSEYITALEEFKERDAENIVKYWGSMEKFNEFIQKAKADETNIAKLAIKQYGSVEKYTEAMKYNLEHFSELAEYYKKLSENKDEFFQKNKELLQKLTKDLTKDPASDEVQEAVGQLAAFSQQISMGIDMGQGYWDIVIESYADDTVKGITDKQYGTGASDFIAKALKHYFLSAKTT